MKQWIAAIKSMGKMQKLAIIAAVAVLLVFGMREKAEEGNVSTEEEMRIERIIEKIEGVKTASVMISYDDKQERAGIVIVADGADDIRTMLEIQRAVKTLTGLQLEQIEIVNSGY